MLFTSVSLLAAIFCYICNAELSPQTSDLAGAPLHNVNARLQSTCSWEVITSPSWARPGPPAASCCAYWNGEIFQWQVCVRLVRRDQLGNQLSFAVNRFR